MAKTITYSFPTVTNNLDGGGSYYHARRVSKQAPPYDEPALYYRISLCTHLAELYNLTGFGGIANASATKSDGVIGPNSYLAQPYNTAWVWASNSARDKFVSSLRKEAMLAVNWVERKQAIDMITKRANQLLRFGSALKRGDLIGVYKSLDLPIERVSRDLRGRVRKSRYATSRYYADTFLEFHFGWGPLMSDISTCVDILQQPVSWPLIKVRGKRFPIDYQLKRLINPPSSDEYNLVQSKGWAQATCSARVNVSNPNLWLANQLGFVNLASVVWELTPWSFVVDWVFNVSQFLSQWTDFAGLTLDRACTTTVMRVPSCDFLYMYAPGGNPSKSRHVRLSGHWVSRDLGIPSVTLGRIPYKPLSAVRGATAISLLAQKLPHWGGPGTLK